MKGSRYTVLRLASPLGLCLFLATLFGTAPRAEAQWNSLNPVVSFENKGQTLEIQQKDGLLRIEVDAPDVLHITYAPPAPAVERASDHVIVKTAWPATEFSVTSDDKAITLTTAR